MSEVCDDGDEGSIPWDVIVEKAQNSEGHEMLAHLLANENGGGELLEQEPPAPAATNSGSGGGRERHPVLMDVSLSDFFELVAPLYENTVFDGLLKLLNNSAEESKSLLDDDDDAVPLVPPDFSSSIWMTEGEGVVQGNPQA